VTGKNGHRKAARRDTSAELPPVAFDAEPRVALVLGDETAWVVQIDRGQAVCTTPVRLEQAASALSQFGAATGLLPEGCLFWHHQRNQDRLGVWLPPSRRRLDFGGGRRRAITVPLPGLVFVGQGRTYWIWAAEKRPARPGERLYHAPLPNVFDDGRICPGTVDFPRCSAATILAAAALFFESGFSQHLANGRVAGAGDATRFLRSLNRKRLFPMNRLALYSKTVGQMMAGDKRQALIEPERVDGLDDGPALRPAPELGEGEPVDEDVFMGDGEEFRDNPAEELEAA
jgi:PRTRC genetic system protein B